jgi:hypothetical protein
MSLVEFGILLHHAVRRALLRHQDELTTSLRSRSFTSKKLASEASSPDEPSMRIAVAGTHRNGKTTLVEAAGRALPGITIEPEPYEQLLDCGEMFLDNGDPESFLAQLGQLVGRLSATRPGDNVIFDRSPLDFIAYIMAGDELRIGRGLRNLEPQVLELATEGLAHLELIAFLPLRAESQPAPRRSLRRLADAHLCDIIRNDSLGVLAAKADLWALELSGSTAQRLRDLVAAVRQYASARVPVGRFGTSA